MDIRQCPRCELRFEHEAELRSHLVIDHDLDPEALEGDYPLEADEMSDADSVDVSGEPETIESGATDTDR